jgi:hypothetical protein
MHDAYTIQKELCMTILGEDKEIILLVFKCVFISLTNLDLFAG